MTPERKPQRDLDENAARHQQEGRWNARHDERRNFAALNVGAPKVASDEACQIAPELQGQRQIKPKLVANVGDHLRVGAAAGDEGRRIGGQIVQKQESDDSDAKQNGDRLHEPSSQQRRHQPRPRWVGSSRSRRASPTRLKESAVARMMAPGMNTSHGAAWK